MSDKWEVVGGKQRKPRQPKPQNVTGITSADCQVVPGLGKIGNGSTKPKKRSAKLPAPFPMSYESDEAAGSILSMMNTFISQQRVSFIIIVYLRI